MSSISLSYTTSSDTATSIVVTWSVYFNNSNGSWSNDPCSGAITFNGSTKSFSATFTSSSKTVGSASFTVTKPKTSSAQSYSCSAWFNAAGTSSGYMSTSSSISIDPKWHYSVAYNANSGSGTMSASTKWYNETLALTANAFSKSGYAFQGWATSSGGSVAYANEANYTSNSGATLYAQWKKDITLSFDDNTGSGAPSSETKSVWNSTTSATFTIPTTTPTKQYYKFTKWNTKADGSGTDYSAGAQYSFSSSTILYAQWVEDYIPPRYGAIDAHRTNSSGSTNNGSGSYGKLTFTWTNGSLSGTEFTTTATAKYREHGASSWTNITNGSSTAKTFSAVFGGGNLSADKQYDILLTLQDTGYPANEYSLFISTEAFTFDVNANGTAIGLMMVAPDNLGARVVPLGVFAKDYQIVVNTEETSGEDYELAQALLSLGWEGLIGLGHGLIDVNTNIDGKSLIKDGTPSANSSFNYTALIPVNDQSSYTWRTSGTSSGATTRLHGYDADGNWLRQLAYFNTNGTDRIGHITPASDIKYVRISYPKVNIPKTGFYKGQF